MDYRIEGARRWIERNGEYEFFVDMDNGWKPIDRTDKEILDKATAMGWEDPAEQVNPKTPEAIAEAVADRMRGGPRKRLMEFAAYAGITFATLLDHLNGFVDSNGEDYINEGEKFDGVHFDLWDEYELVTGRVVPAGLRHSPFSCSC